MYQADTRAIKIFQLHAHRFEPLEVLGLLLHGVHLEEHHQKCPSDDEEDQHHHHKHLVVLLAVVLEEKKGPRVDFERDVFLLEVFVRVELDKDRGLGMELVYLKNHPSLHVLVW